MKNRNTVMLAALIALTLLLWLFVTLGTAAPQAIYEVNSSGDDADSSPGDGNCIAAKRECTLHAAIEEANLDGVASTIVFSNKMEISYPSLPALTEAGTTIDAANQWDGIWPNGRPGVKIIRPGYLDGILDIKADSIIVRGIEFVGAGGVGVNISGGSFSKIGGTAAGQRNVFLAGTGVNIQTTGFNHTVAGNYFGTWDGNNPVPSNIGIEIRTDGNFIEDNLIGSHTNAGIFIWGGNYNQIRRNIIGADKLKNSPLPNAIGLRMDSADLNIVGPSNTISGNTGPGIEMKRSDQNSFYGNDIGNGFTFGNGGDGLYVHTSNNNQLGLYPGNSIVRNGGHGIYITASDGNTIRHNSIGGNGLDGIFIDSGKETVIGGTDPTEINVLTGNGANGIHLSGSGTISSVVSGNEIGFSQSAFNAGNAQHGILIAGGSSSNKIGGLDTGAGNRIGFNDWSGIYLTGQDTQNNVVEGNIIGAPVNWGWEAPNGHHGISLYDGTHNNWIGWGNTIVASGWSGVGISNSHDNIVWFNRIGSDGADVKWGNTYYGVHIAGGANNVILFNDIAYSGVNDNRAGVRVEGAAATFNTINTNSIHDNGGVGIELLSGGNMSLGAPSISQASCQGPVSGSSCPGCKVELFSDTAEEGKIFEAAVTADAASGAFIWNGTPNGPNVTATSTDGLGNTSPFSTPASLEICNSAPSAAFKVTPPEGPLSTVFQFDASTSSDVEDSPSALDVRWDWEDDGTFDTNWSKNKTAEHQFNAGGLYTTRLEVRDSGDLIDAATNQIHVTEPTAASYRSFVPAMFIP